MPAAEEIIMEGQQFITETFVNAIFIALFLALAASFF